MKTEFETRFLDIDKTDFISKITALGAIDKGEFKLSEFIFYDKELTWLSGNQFIRLRQKGEDITLTYKKHIGHGVDSAQETEFKVSSVEKTKEFLENIGFLNYRTVEKIRHTFELDGVIFDIDTWPKIPTYVELEGESIEALLKMAERVGLDWNKRFDQDPRFVFKHYGFDLDNIRTVTFDKFE